MTDILADNDVEGFVGVIVTIRQSDPWRDNAETLSLHDCSRS